MKRLLIYIIILTTLFSGGIALTSAMGRTAPPPAFAQWFTYADGSPCPMPCLFGIRPGVTRWEDVDNFLKTHPLLRDLQPSDMTSASPESIQRTFIYPGSARNSSNFSVQRDRDGVVGEIQFNALFNQPLPRVGEIWILFGLPQCAAVLNNQNSIPRYTVLGYSDTRTTLMEDSPTQSRYFHFADRIVSFGMASKMFSQGIFGTFLVNWNGFDKEYYLQQSRRAKPIGCLR